MTTTIFDVIAAGTPTATAIGAPGANPQTYAGLKALVERGRVLANFGDCTACHTRPDGQPFAGNFPLKTPFGTQSTFRRRVLLVPIEFRLDWVWLRGLEATNSGIDRQIEISDHWPLWANIKVAAIKK